MGAEHVRVVEADAREFSDEQGFDRVLVDPPCSGLGTLQARPDLRWQPRRGELGELAARQAELLRAGAAALRPGGTLVYSVCTISRAEADDVVDAFVAEHPEFSVESRWQLMPSTDGTDGFFIARPRTSETCVRRQPVTFEMWTMCRRFWGRSARSAASRGCVRRRLPGATDACTA